MGQSKILRTEKNDFPVESDDDYIRYYYYKRLKTRILSPSP